MEVVVAIGGGGRRGGGEGGGGEQEGATRSSKSAKYTRLAMQGSPNPNHHMQATVLGAGREEPLSRSSGAQHGVCVA